MKPTEEFDAYECAILHCCLRSILKNGCKPEWLDAEQKELLNRLADSLLDDCEHQKYWEKISCLLDGTSESEPMLVDYILPSVEDESCGLSDLEKLNIDKVYQIEGEGTMWYHFEGTAEWNDMYELSTNDLKGLYEYLLTI